MIDKRAYPRYVAFLIGLRDARAAERARDQITKPRKPEIDRDHGIDQRYRIVVKSRTIKTFAGPPFKKDNTIAW